MDIRDRIRRAAACRVLFLRHAVSQMSRPDRMIDPDEVRQVLNQGEVIEDYPDDPRGPSCLMSARTSEGRVVHVVCSPKEEYLAVITAYLPAEQDWEDGFRRRKR